MSSPTAEEILDNITTSCLDMHPGVFPIPVAPAGILPRYDAACVAVAKAKTIDEVREIAFSAEALRAYARQARNRQLELDAAEIRIRADRRVGELMAGQRIVFGTARPPGANQYQHRVETKPDAPPTLAEAGIDKNQAHRSRSALGEAHDPSARGYAGTSPFEWGGMHDEVRSLRRWGRMAAPEAHDHIDHIRGHIDHTDVTDDDHMKTARATTPKYLSRLIFPRPRASG